MLLLSTYARMFSMSTSESARAESASKRTPKTDTYHHGNLRQALLLAARELACESGIDSLTLREVARRAGVSHAAPYNHFSDKAALTRAMAAEAFHDLANALRVAAATQRKPLKALEAVGKAYLRYAFEHPAEFRFIFRDDLRQDETDEVNKAGERAYGVLLETVRTCHEAGLLSDQDPDLLALTAWSTTHGLATLLVSGPQQHLKADPRAFERTVTAVLGVLQEGLFKR